MQTETFKVLEWLRRIRHEHYETAKSKTWEEDRKEISAKAKEMTEQIKRRKAEKAV
jgi:hypothetical protein